MSNKICYPLKSCSIEEKTIDMSYVEKAFVGSIDQSEVDIQMFLRLFIKKLAQFALFQEGYWAEPDCEKPPKTDFLEFDYKEKKVLVKLTSEDRDFLLLEKENWDSDNIEKYDYVGLLQMMFPDNSLIYDEKKIRAIDSIYYYELENFRDEVWEQIKHLQWKYSFPGFVSQNRLSKRVAEDRLIPAGAVIRSYEKNRGKRRLDYSYYYCPIESLSTKEINEIISQEEVLGINKNEYEYRFSKEEDIDYYSREKILYCIDKSFLVEAGAGSGKTGAMSQRLVAMVERGISLNYIYAFSFTKASSEELAGRFVDLLYRRSFEEKYDYRPNQVDLPEPTNISKWRCSAAISLLANSYFIDPKDWGNKKKIIADRVKKYHIVSTIDSFILGEINKNSHRRAEILGISNTKDYRLAGKEKNKVSFMGDNEYNSLVYAFYEKISEKLEKGNLLLETSEQREKFSQIRRLFVSLNSSPQKVFNKLFKKMMDNYNADYLAEIKRIYGFDSDDSCFKVAINWIKKQNDFKITDCEENQLEILKAMKEYNGHLGALFNKKEIEDFFIINDSAIKLLETLENSRKKGKYIKVLELINCPEIIDYLCFYDRYIENKYEENYKDVKLKNGKMVNRSEYQAQWEKHKNYRNAKELEIINSIKELQYEVSLVFVSFAKELFVKWLISIAGNEAIEERSIALPSSVYQTLFLEFLKKDIADTNKASSYMKEVKNNYYLVDEFQDVSPLQMQIFSYLSSNNPKLRWDENVPRKGALFLVGDPKQSIYHFRDADVSVYFQVKRIFDNHPDNCEVLLLTRNFRSTDNLLKQYNHTFTNMFVESEAQCSYATIPLNERNENQDTDKYLSGIYKLSFAMNDNRFIGKYSPKDNSNINMSIIELIDYIKDNCKILDKGQYRNIVDRDILILYRKKIGGDNSESVGSYLESIMSGIKYKNTNLMEVPINQVEEIVVSTIHSSKGLERPIVILLPWNIPNTNVDSLKRTVGNKTEGYILYSMEGYKINTYGKEFDQLIISRNFESKKGQEIKGEDGISNYQLLEREIAIKKAEDDRLVYVAATRANNAVFVLVGDGYSYGQWHTLSSVTQTLEMKE